jgi:PIN domain nuclease of toxin-antitoxin system
MAGLLLDTNALVWFLAEEPLEASALFEIATAQQAGLLHVSPISAWEASLAIRKTNEANRPNLNGQDAATWFQRGRRSIGARLLSIGQDIALEAARVPDVYGIGDPGDCYLIATARIKGLSIVTRDRRMARLAAARPDYLQIVAC